MSEVLVRRWCRPSPAIRFPRAALGSLAVLVPLALLVALPGCGDGDDLSCADVSFPAPPSDVEQVLYVAAPCDAGSADGTLEHPYAHINDAIARADPGAAILIAADTSYAESLLIDKPLRLLGAPVNTIAESATVTLNGNLGSGIVVGIGVKGVLLRGLVLDSSKAVGLWVPDNADVKVEGVMVRDTEPDGDGNGGYGILATDGGRVDLSDVTVQRAATVGIYVKGGRVVMTDTEVTAVQGHGGIRIEDAIDTAILGKTLVDGCAEVGILVSNSRATLTGTIVLHTTPSNGGFGDGIVVRRRKNAAGKYATKAEAIIEGAVITQSARVGVLFAEGAEGSLSGSTVSSNGLATGRSAGVWVQSGAGAAQGILITKNVLRQNLFVGVGLTSGARASVLDNAQIRETQHASMLLNGQIVDIGVGVGIFAGALGEVRGNGIDDNHLLGVLMDAPAANTVLESNSITGNEQFGLVIQNAKNGIPPFLDNLFDANGFGPTLVLGEAEPAMLVQTGDFALP